MTRPPTPAGAADVRRPPWWGVTALLLISLVAWAWLHRSWFPAGDDYLLTSDGHSPGAAFSAGYWWDALREDWLRRNGRLADAVLRLVLRPGEWFYPLFAPLMLTTAGALLAVTTRLAAGLRVTPLWLWVTGLGAIPLVCWLVPGMTGDVILWTAGAVNYALPLATLLGAMTILLGVLSGRTMSWWIVLAGCLLVALSDALQEVTSAAMVCVAIAVLAMRHGRLGKQALALVATALAAFCLHMSAPGLWLRSDAIVATSGHGFVEATLRGMAASSVELWSRTQVLWIALAVVLAVHAWHSGRTPVERVALLIGALCCAAYPLAAAVYTNRLPLIPQPRLVLVLAVAGITMLAFLAVGLALFLARTSLGEGVVLAWVAFVGSCFFPFASGTTGPRVHFAAIVLLLLTLLTLVTGWINQLSPQQALAAALIVVGVPSISWFDQTRIGAAANKQFVEVRIVAPLQAAARGETVEVQLPAALPHQDLAYWAAFLLERYRDSLRVYYGVPEDVVITNG